MHLSESEGANHWLSVLTDLQNRGVQDILIACVDGLKGFPEAIAAIYPQTEIQLCIVHQIRNSLRYVASKDQKAFMADLKPIYRADTKGAAEVALDELEKMGRKIWCGHSVMAYQMASTIRLFQTVREKERNEVFCS